MDYRSYKPAWWLRGGHAQTVWASIIRRVPLQSRIEMLELPDGDVTQLDWVGRGNGPIIIVLPGLHGDLRSGYARGLLVAFAKRGWRGVLLNYRGCPNINRQVRSYHCGQTKDLDYLVEELGRRHPGVPLAVVGFSLGANITLKWMGEHGRDGKTLPIVAACAISAPLHMGRVAKRIDEGFSRVYQNRLIRGLHRDVRRKMRTMDVGMNLTEKELRGLNTFLKFDDRITGPINGFANGQDYYEQTRTDTLLRQVCVPTLLLNARNDPLIPRELLPTAEVLSEHIRLEITEEGGHMGFVEGRVPGRAKYWLDHRIPAFIGPYMAQRQKMGNGMPTPSPHASSPLADNDH